jgi:hypothetical protein
MTPRPRRIDRGHLQIRILGEYLVVPRNPILRMVRRPSDRLDLALSTLGALKTAIDRVNALIDDTIIELRDKHDVPWSVLGKRVKLNPSYLQGRIAARRRLLNPDPRQDRSPQQAA